mgnify:FL=1
MAKYQLTLKAENDIDNIAEYSVLNFGLAVARRYLAGLHETFEKITDHPDWGNDYNHILPGLLRYEYRSHAVYFMIEPDAVHIIRVLGGRQAPKLHIDLGDYRPSKTVTR